MSRIDVRKTYKLAIGGQFPRSESGRTYEVTDASGKFLANASRASRKDARDAVVAARKAFGGWAGKTPYNRGQVLYRVAEVLEGRRAQFAEQVARAEGVDRASAERQVDAAVDRWVWHAGLTDKLAQLHGSVNPVAGPFLDVSAPEPSGVVAVLAPQGSSLLGLVSVLAPPLVSGCAVVVLASQDRPLPAVDLAEVLATSDVPAGAVNVLTGATAEVAPWLASHADVDVLDLAGAALLQDPSWGDLEAAAAATLTRVVRPDLDGAEPDWAAGWTAQQQLRRVVACTDLKTVWHPKGL